MHPERHGPAGHGAPGPPEAEWAAVHLHKQGRVLQEERAAVIEYPIAVASCRNAPGISEYFWADPPNSLFGKVFCGPHPLFASEKSTAGRQSRPPEAITRAVRMEESSAIVITEKADFTVWT